MTESIIKRLFEEYQSRDAYNAEQADKDYLFALSRIEKLLDDESTELLHNALFMQGRLSFSAGVKTAIRLMSECYSEQ